MKNLVKLVERTHAQVKWWSYAGWTLPFVAIAVIVFENFFGYESWLNITAASIIIIFLSAAVFWWWWALSKISIVMQSMKNSNDTFLEIKEEIKEAKKTLKEIDADNRKWRK
jgi:uncharacterized membrane protein YfbV (UPF0208 family)